MTVLSIGYDEGLEVTDLSVRYGGHRAVDHVSLAAPLARLTGLIGPNGAGKTTLFNTCSGLLTPSGGEVCLFGEEVTRLPAVGRARRGLGRTFQKMQLFNSFSVRDNVQLGREAQFAASNPLRQLVGRPAERVLLRGVTDEAIELCGLGDVAGERAGALSTGQRRLTELARVIAGGYRVLLLDEPSSGLDPVETAAFARIVRRLVDERRVGILLVEHDMALVSAVCDYLYVIDFGRLIFEGAAPEVLHSPVVRAAYLGDEAGLDMVETKEY